MNLLQQLDKEQVAKLSAGKQYSDFQPGDTVLVNVKVVEGERSRIQAYEGVCIGRSGTGGMRTSPCGRFPTAKASSACSALCADDRPRSSWCAEEKYAAPSSITCAAGAARRHVSPKAHITAARRRTWPRLRHECCGLRPIGKARPCRLRSVVRDFRSFCWPNISVAGEKLSIEVRWRTRARPAHRTVDHLHQGDRGVETAHCRDDEKYRPATEFRVDGRTLMKPVIREPLLAGVFEITGGST